MTFDVNTVFPNINSLINISIIQEKNVDDDKQKLTPYFFYITCLKCVCQFIRIFVWFIVQASKFLERKWTQTTLYFINFQNNCQIYTTYNITLTQRNLFFSNLLTQVIRNKSMAPLPPCLIKKMLIGFKRNNNLYNMHI